MKQPDQSQTDLPNISAPATRALASIGITRLEQLTTVTEADLNKLHGMGPKGIRLLKEALETRGLSLKAS
jgi:DNA-directed RNA polymerase alpha subunit